MTEATPSVKQLRLAWASVVVMAAAGFFLGLAPAERKLERSAERAHELYDLATRNERLLRGSTALAAARDRVALDIAHLSGRQGSATLQTLRLLNGEASRFHITIGELSPNGQIAPGNGSLNVTIAIQGTYRNVVLTIADMSQHGALLEIGDVALAPIADSGDREIDATVHATIYYQVEAIMKERQGAAIDGR